MPPGEATKDSQGAPVAPQVHETSHGNAVGATGAKTGKAGHQAILVPTGQCNVATGDTCWARSDGNSHTLLPEWSGGKAPYRWEKVKANPLGDYPCACVNGTEPCESAQTCLWFSVGCTLGCSECDGGSKGGSNPNRHDRCGNGTGKATINDPMYVHPPGRMGLFNTAQRSRFRGVSGGLL
eukprot:SAG11_NODE_3146_length_2650_cov_1.956880_3_plen_181_part_00